MSSAGWAALGTGVADLAGQFYSASQARDLYGRQENFQREMSNTSHQREVEDLRKAGLNPILSATGGAGASTPAGSSITPSGIDAGKSVASALAVLNLKKDLGLAEADTKLKNAQAEGTVQSAKESLVREEGMKQSMGIESNKFEFEKRFRELDKYSDYVSKGLSGLGDVGSLLKQFRSFKNPGSAKGISKP